MADLEQVDILKLGIDQWKQWRERCPMAAVDLSGAVLKGLDARTASLESANLSDASLQKAILSNAKLANANLCRARLYMADLAWADLRGANLTDADLTGADLTGAKLENAILVRTRLYRTTFSTASIGNTILVDVDLSFVFGIDRVEQSRPSTVSLQTLEMTALGVGRTVSADLIGGGAITSESTCSWPEAERFFQGVGVDQSYLGLARSSATDPKGYFSCFISYCHSDQSFAQYLHDRLQSKGIRCWLDLHKVAPGDDIFDKIDQGIRLWDKVLLVCSESSLRSYWVHKELEKALSKEEMLWKERNKKVALIIPLNLDGYLFNWKDGKATVLRSRLAADFTGWKDDVLFDREFEKVMIALRVDEGGRGEVPDPKI